jgi:methylated-DNA-protein-cysteine methyltransferase-like protein
MTAFTERVLAVIRTIPRGKVMTYGMVAAAAGAPNAARGVAWILHSSSSTARLPWHRVLGKDGRISLPPDRGGDDQRALLEAEGVVFGMSGRVDLRRHVRRWRAGR